MLILTHVGSDIPQYVQYMFEQLRIHNDGHDVVMLANKEALNNYSSYLKNFNIKGVPIESIADHSRLCEFNKLSFYRNWGKPNTSYPSPENFVQGTSERLFVLDAFIEKENLENIFHCENDVMIYGDLNEIIEQSRSQSGVTVTPMSHIDITCAMMHVQYPTDLAMANEFMIEQIRRGDEAIKERFKMPFVCEMSLLKAYGRRPMGLNYFPISPGSPQISRGQFNMVFDPASYGQWHGGTNNGHAPGFIDPIHYVGQDIKKGVLTTFIKDGLPYVSEPFRDKTYPLANLHIHSKDLKRFLTYELQGV